MSELSALRRIQLFSSLDEQEIRALAGSMGKRTFAKGVILFHDGSPGETLYIIESGKIRIYVLSESGQEISVNVYGAGEVFGELSVLDGLPRSASAVAVEQTVVFTLHRDDLLEQLRQSPQMAMSIIRMLCSRLRYTTEYAESLAFLDICGRVATRLLELSDRYSAQDEGGEIEVPLTQGELATWVGASRESVNKALRTLRAQGLIRLHGRKITLLDRRRLRRVARC